MQKTAIITGGSAGLGFCTALRAAAAGFDLIIASRNQFVGRDAVSRIQRKFPEIKVDYQPLDLSDALSISEFAEKIREPWDLLINNAGAKIQKPYKETTTGHEWHVGVNHLGHFSLTSLLFQKAKAGATVTTVTSIVARKGQANFSRTQLNFDERQAYADSKFLNLAFAASLSRKLAQTGMKSTLAHPGFARAEPYGNPGVRVGEYIAAQSAWRGSEPIWEASQAANGAFLVPKVFELWGKPKLMRIPDISPQKLDEIWLRSEELSGVEFNLPPSFGVE